MVNPAVARATRRIAKRRWILATGSLITGVAGEDLDGDRTTVGGAEQAEDDLILPFLPSRLWPKAASGALALEIGLEVTS